MTKYESSGAESISAATEYPVGLTFDASFHAFAFTALGPAIGHHGIGRLRWSIKTSNPIRL